MYRREKEINLIKKINKYNLNINRNENDKRELLKYVCEYFDIVKNEDLTQSDLQFLKYISNIVGVPQYFDTLKKFNKSDLEIKNINLLTFSNFVNESCLQIDDTDITLHKYQKYVYDLFNKDKQNRYFLTAPTSFGKTFLIYPLIKKMKYNNILLIFPTIALLSENLKKLLNDINFSEYKIHTLSKIQDNNLDDKNIFIFTPERFLSYLDNNQKVKEFDFIFIDEIYKIDNDFMDNQEIKENERDLAYRLALYNSFKSNPYSDILLSGPYISCGNSFNDFLKYNRITLLNFNETDLVNKKYNYIFEDKRLKKDELLFNSIEEIINNEENCIIYTSGPGASETLAKKILNKNLNSYNNINDYEEFIKHLENNFDENWILVKSLKNSIGIHHGSIPKYIQNKLIDLFNDNKIRILISTTTLTEGVNTNAKNVIVYNSKKGKKNLKKFDAENIMGRAGRFREHYSGNIIILEEKFKNIISSKEELLEHKNFDIERIKTEQEIFDIESKYLNENDKEMKKKLIEIKNILRPELINSYKMISLEDKNKIYNNLKNKMEDKNFYNNLINSIGNIRAKKYTKENFEFIYDVLIIDIIKNNDLLKRFKSLSGLICAFLISGLKGMINYKKNKLDDIDKIVRDNCKLIYQTFKYHLVKYLGIFNICYKIIVSEKEQKEINDIEGIDFLLKKLEYGAFSNNGVLASDFGVPSKIIEYYDKLESEKKLAEAENIKNNFDDFEKIKFEEIENFINKNNQ